MFNIIDCEQGSEDWLKARLGNLTASTFSKIMTPKGKLSASADEQINLSVAEKIMQQPREHFQSAAMERGNELEQEALDFFNFTYDYSFEKVGFVDTGKGYGCSPDAMDTNINKGLELKCPEPHTHLAYLGAGILPTKYVAQVQGSMFVTGFDSWVFGSYHPELPCFHIEVKRDEEYIGNLERNLNKCAQDIKEKFKTLSEMIKAGGVN